MAHKNVQHYDPMNLRYSMPVSRDSGFKFKFEHMQPFNCNRGFVVTRTVMQLKVI